jgi:predicted MPP superfamily phosphohydrolase
LLAVFLTVALSVLGGLHHYFSERLLIDPQWPQPFQSAGLWLVWAAALSLVLTPIAERTLSPRITRFIAWPASLWMGSIFYLLLGLGLSDGAFALAGWSGVALARMRAEVVVCVTLALVIAGVTSVVLGPRIKQVPIRLRRWPKRLDGYRIVQISDIHIGPVLHREFAQRVVELVHQAKPDLIVVTGDLVDGGVRQLEAEVAPFAQLRARHGVFFVTGNHDFYSGAGHWTRKVTELGMSALRNRHVTVEDGETGCAFVLAGVDDPTGSRMGGAGADVKAALAGVPQDRAVILLAHDPRTFEQASTAGVDLQLSGHTHDGQLWPFNWAVRMTTRFVAGLYRVGDSQLYVSRGTGFWGPPMRVLAPAEVSVLVLHGVDC